MDDHTVITRTEYLMSILGINTRDTWNGLYGNNLDDFYCNCKWGGPRRFRIEYDCNVNRCQVKANKQYSIPGYNHIAYDEYVIQVPKRMSDRTDALIHETVHFLQISTNSDEASYINFTGNNYLEYISQRCELEAHAVHILFLSEESNNIPNNIVEGIKSGSSTAMIKAIVQAKKLNIV